jgi:hypothetical protein
MALMSKLSDRCLELAWSQWTALGVRGVIDAPDDAIDLEALILFTPTLRDIDPRLFDEALDWCVRFGPDTVSVSRLRRLFARLPDDQQASVAELSGAVQHHAGVTWPGADQPHRHRLSGKSRPPASSSHPSLIQLRARRALGVSARAEIFIAMMLEAADVSFGVAELSHLGYAKQSLLAILEDLVDADLVERMQRGNQHRYRLKRRNELRALMHPLPRSAPPWMLRLPILAGLRIVRDRFAKKPAIVQDVEMSNELRRQLPRFRSLGYADTGIPLEGYGAERLEDWALVMLTGPTPGFQAA